MNFSFFTFLVAGHSSLNIIIISSYYFAPIKLISFISNYIGDYLIIYFFLLLEIIFFGIMSYLITVRLLKNFNLYTNIDIIICLINLLTSYIIITIIITLILLTI